MPINSPSVLLSQADSTDLVNLAADFQLTIGAADKDRLIGLELGLDRTLPRLAHRKRNELSTRAVETKIHCAYATRRRRQRFVKTSYVDDLPLHGSS